MATMSAILTLLVCLVPSISCYCFQSMLKVNVTVSGKVRSYCEFPPRFSGGNGALQLLPGSRVYLASDCLDCTCSMDGLSCCGFGSHGGVVGLPDGCKKIQDGCHEMFVRVSDENVDCFTGKPLNFSENLGKPHPDNTFSMNREKQFKDDIIKAASAVAASSQKTRFNPILGRAMAERKQVAPIATAQDWTQLFPGMGQVTHSRHTSPNVRKPVMELINDILKNRVPAETAWRAITRVTPTSRSWTPELRTVPRVQTSQHQSFYPPMTHPMDIFGHDFVLPFFLAE